MGKQQDLKVPFGRRGARLWAPGEVARGLGCNCVCPGCGAALMARSGPGVRPHFAHHKAVPRPDCFETALHLAAKQWLLENRKLRLPGLSGALRVCTLRRRELQHGHTLFEPRLQDLAEVELERSLGDVRPDAWALTAEGEPVLVEFWVTHKVDAAKHAHLRRLNLPVVEVSLGDLHVSSATDWDAALAQRLTAASEHVRWVHHPRENELRQHLEKLAAIEMEADYQALVREQASSVHRMRQEQQARRRAALEYQALSHERKLLWTVAQWGLPIELLPPFMNCAVPAQGAFGVPRRVWQAEATREFLHHTPHGGWVHAHISATSVALWLAFRLGAEDVPPPVQQGQLRAVQAWLEALYDMRLLKPGEAVDRWAISHFAVREEFARASRGGGTPVPPVEDTGLVWEPSKWPRDREEATLLALEFTQDLDEAHFLRWAAESLSPEPERMLRERPRDYALRIAQYAHNVSPLRILAFFHQAGLARKRRPTEHLAR